MAAVVILTASADGLANPFQQAAFGGVMDLSDAIFIQRIKATSVTDDTAF